MGLMANIPAVEAAQALVFARGIGMAFGDHKSTAAAIYATTGSGRLAQRVEIDAMRQAKHG
jgi:hypothetical protein